MARTSCASAREGFLPFARSAAWVPYRVSSVAAACALTKEGSASRDLGALPSYGEAGTEIVLVRGIQGCDPGGSSESESKDLRRPMEATRGGIF